MSIHLTQNMNDDEEDGPELIPLMLISCFAFFFDEVTSYEFSFSSERIDSYPVIWNWGEDYGKS